MEFDIHQIIKKCKKNDRTAQKMLYDKYAPLFLAICMRYAKDKAEAEDILQDGFLKILMNILQYTGSGSFEGWMKRIIINTAITNYHQNIKHYFHEEIDNIKDLEADNDFYMNDIDFSKEELMDIIQQLPEGYRVVFNLFVLEGYKHKEIAEMLKIDIGTSKSQFARAKKIIQTRLSMLRENVFVA
jgi:RNA polymerase sigma factor (sigma-70 family)